MISFANPPLDLAEAVPCDGGLGYALMEPPLVAIAHPTEGCRCWPIADGRDRVDLAVQVGGPPAWREEDASPVVPPFERVTLRRKEVYAERICIGWAYVGEGDNPVGVLRAAFPEFREFEEELRWEVLMEPRRHRELLRALGLVR